MPRALSSAQLPLARRRSWPGFLADQRGLATVEFIILLTCIAVGGILAWQTMGTTIVSIIGEEDKEDKEDQEDK